MSLQFLCAAVVPSIVLAWAPQTHGGLHAPVYDATASAGAAVWNLAGGGGSGSSGGGGGGHEVDMSPGKLRIDLLKNMVTTIPREYMAVYNCSDNSPTTGDVGCEAAFWICNPTGDPMGPVSMRQYGRVVGETGWTFLGTTCYTGSAPPNTPLGRAVAARPVLTYAMIVNAFHRTPFAKPETSIQPVGNATLVRLPTYFQLTWPSAGYGPGEVDQVDPSTVAGYDVKIRPKATTYTYAFGDGSSVTTTSLGGPYPDGDVRHTYTKAGNVTTTITATYGADYSVNGGEWIPMTGTSTVVGPGEPLSVRTAQNELIQGGQG